MSYNIQGLTTQGCTLTQQSQILLLVTLGLQSNTHQIDGVDLDRADRQSRTADGVDERIQLGSIRQQTATVTQSGNIAAHKEVAVIPLDIMVGAPTSELFIHELAVLVQQAVGQHRECEHILATDVRHDFHKHLLVLDNVLNLVNDIGAVGILDTTEQGLDVVAVEDGHIDECGLVDTHEGLVQTVNQLLETLTDVVVGILDDITSLTILLPEVVSPDEDVGNTDSAGATVAHVADVLDNIVEECGQVVGSLIVVVLQEEQTLGCQTSQVVGVTVRQVCSGRCVMQIERTVVFGFEPFLCGTQVVPLLHLVENLVECEELIVGLGLLIQHTADILIGRIGICVNRGICHILIDEVVDEIREVQLGLMESVQNLEVLTVLLVHGVHRLFKVGVHLQGNVHMYVLLSYC